MGSLADSSDWALKSLREVTSLGFQCERGTLVHAIGPVVEGGGVLIMTTNPFFLQQVTRTLEVNVPSPPFPPISELSV